MKPISDISKKEMELYKVIQQQKNFQALKTFLDSQNDNIDLVLTQLVINMHQHFKSICPNDLGLDYSFNALLELLNCVFYGDIKSKNELDYTISPEYDLTKEDVLIRYFKLVMALDKIRHHTNKIF